MNVLDLFSGIGGFSLGLERAGMRTIAFCESDEFCRRVLRQHWPVIPIYDDVRTLTAERLMADARQERCNGRPAHIQSETRSGSSLTTGIDVICGGFPCQDISVAGKGAGLGGARSGLWSEFARIIGEVRPRYVIVENVAALLGRGFTRVLGDLATLGFDAEWHCIPASAVGAPHRRDRVWIIATDAQRGELWQQPGRGDGACGANPAVAGNDGEARSLADSDGGRRERFRFTQHVGQQGASRDKPNGRDTPGRRPRTDIRLARSLRLPLGPGTLAEWAHAATTGTGWWATESDVGRVVDGPAARLDRRKRLIALGNSLVPQIAEIIGRAISSRNLIVDSDGGIW